MPDAQRKYKFITEEQILTATDHSSATKLRRSCSTAPRTKASASLPSLCPRSHLPRPD